MKYSTQVFSANPIEEPSLEDEFDEIALASSIEDLSSEDEFDEFCSQLLHIEPPATLVNDILTSVASLPLPEVTSEDLLDTREGLMIHDTLLWQY